MVTGGYGTSMTSSVGEYPAAQPPTSPKELYKSKVFDDASKLYQQLTVLTDVMVAADDQSIPCHNVLLAASSAFFNEKFHWNTLLDM